MNLNKQLWLTILAIVALNGVISFGLLFSSSQQMFEEQLYLKNLDNANSLAIVLTQADKSEASMELLTAAKFDAGHYARIELTDANHSTLIKLEHKAPPTDIPDWFIRFAGFNIPPGTAQVADGWSQFGTVHIESQTSYALEMLWHRFRQFIASLMVLTIAVGLIGTVILRIIIRPLDDIVEQARSFSQRRFVTLKRPATPDFAKVVDAMNSLATRFKTIVIENNTRLEDARFRSQHDLVTGLPNINAFFTQLESQLRYRDTDGQNVLLVHSLASSYYDIQTVVGQNYDEVMSEFADRVKHFYHSHPTFYTDLRMARINETDIAVLLTDAISLGALEQEMQASEDFKGGLPVSEDLHASICTSGVYMRGDEASYELMDRVDVQLEVAQSNASLLSFNLEPLPAGNFVHTGAQWQQLISRLPESLEIKQAPLKNAQQQALHQQAFFTLTINRQPKNLSYVVRTAKEAGSVPQLDLICLQALLKRLKQHPQEQLALLLYPSSISSAVNRERLYQQLDRHRDLLPRLSLELRESSASHYPAEFKIFCRELKRRGVGVGLKRVGESFSQVADIHEFGLDYVKIDSAYVYDLKNNQTNQTYLRGLCDLAHSLGMKVYADGVGSELDKDILFEIGFDGVVMQQQ